ncbi:MAG TPA: chemotaxis protein CheB [Nitrospira sp.]|nr:chemotaxis protein CheB [Nitrospira sp.]
MTTPRKSERGLAPTKIDVRIKGAERRSVNTMTPWAQPTPTTDLPARSSGDTRYRSSADGLETIEAFSRHMSPISGMAFVMVSHQHPGRVSFLPGLLGNCSALSVVEVTEEM